MALNEMARPFMAVFFDKDGTLVHDVPYNVAPARTAFREGAFAALKRLAAHGWKLFVVSNQAGIAHGLFTPRELEGLVDFLYAAFLRNGVRLGGFYHCPHHPEAALAAYRRVCRCRKPGDALLRQAANDHGVELARSWVVGDILDDVEAGRRAGCRTVLLDVGNETQWCLTPMRTPDFRAKSLVQAADRILASP